MILAITPARGGSKGIPRKNIKTIAGKPLLAWTIEAAKESKLIDRYIVSTEDVEIANVARRYGAEVLDRPYELARDETPTIDVLQDVIKKIPCDIVVLLQATSPMRSTGLIDACIKEFIDRSYDSLATGYMCMLKEYGTNELRRQDIKGFFYDDGNVYVLKSDLVKRGERYGKKIGRKVISRRENFEIDDETDFWILEKMLEESGSSSGVKCKGTCK